MRTSAALLALVLAADLSGVAHAADLCPRRFDTSEIMEATRTAEDAVGVDATAFRTSQHDMEERLACSADILSPDAQAHILLVETVAALADRRDERIVQALGGVFAVEPGLQIPSTLAPEGHPIRERVPAAMLALRDDPGVELPHVASGWIEADGALAHRAPTQRAAILQQIDGQGLVVATRLRWPDDVGFDWVVGATSSSIADVVPPTLTPSPWAHRAPWLAGAGASLVTSGVLLAMAADARGEFDAEPSLSPDVVGDDREEYAMRVREMQGRANGLSVGGYVAGGVAVALGSVTVVTW